MKQKRIKEVDQRMIYAFQKEEKKRKIQDAKKNKRKMRVLFYENI